MYITRVLLLSIIALIIFFPSIEAWLTSDISAWYRPYAIWLLVIVGAWLNQRTSSLHEL